MGIPIFSIESLFCCVSVLLVCGIICIVLKTPLVYFFKDKPGTRKIHQRTIPRAGGICISVTFCAVLCLWKSFSFPGFPHLSPLLFNVCLIVIVGILMIGFFDDWNSFAISKKAKFILECVIAAEVVLIFGMQFPEINVFGLLVVKNKLLLSLFSIFWIVGVANAVNISDGINGLAGTLMCISFVTVAFLAMHAHVPDLAVLSVIIVFCVVGFLVHNVSPARVFLGDTGSLFLGMLLSIFLMHLVVQLKGRFSIYIAFLIAGYPVLDLAMAMGRRFFRSALAGETLYQSIRAIPVGDSNHSHHRLIYRGLSHTQATVIISTLSATLCVAASYISLYQELKYAILIYMSIVVLWFFYELNYFHPIIMYVKRTFFGKSGNCRHRIGVIDADPVFRHALSRFRQRKFRFDFMNHQDFATSDPFHEMQLKAVTTSNEQFFIPAARARDTPRKFSKGMVLSVLKDLVISESGGGAPFTLNEVIRPENAVCSKKSQEFPPFTAIVINCRNAADFDDNLFLGRQLVEKMRYAVIMVMDLLPDGSNSSGDLPKEILFIRRPLYTPVFFDELYRLAKKRKITGSKGTFPNESAIFGKIAG
jgi:UDP-GlcNAc:undecaprenyl-phosphate/decaprenyl-phosphate GlcNAc-1-phosphate transferase